MVLEKSFVNVCRAWYPLLLSKDLKVSPMGKRVAPHGVCLLGIPLVIFRDKTGQAFCLEDKCPHRSAPLSIGQVVDGVLECAYHGWQLEGIHLLFQRKNYSITKTKIDIKNIKIK